MVEANEESMEEFPCPSLASKVLLCQDPLVLLVPNFLATSSCQVLQDMCAGDGEERAMFLDHTDVNAPWTDGQRRLLMSIDCAIGDLTGLPPCEFESPLSPLVVNPTTESSRDDSSLEKEDLRWSNLFPAGLHVDTNGSCPKRFAAAVLYLNSPNGGQTAFPLARPLDGVNDLDSSIPCVRGPEASLEVLQAGRFLIDKGVLHTRHARTPEAISAASRLVCGGGNGTGLAAVARQGSLVVFWCRRSDGSECPRSWHSGMRVGLGGEPKYILRKFKSMPDSVWEGSQEGVTAFVRATRTPHLPSIPRCTEEGVFYFEANPYMDDGRELTGSILWDGSQALAKFVAWREACGGEKSIVGKTVLELGAGTGIVGLTLARLGATVLLTDREPEILALLNRNVDVNSLGQRVSVRQVDFEKACTYMTCDGQGCSASVDLIVGSEVLYEQQQALCLARLLEAHMPCGCASEFLLAYSHREEAPLDVFLSTMFDMGFSLERLENQEGYTVAGAKGLPSSIYGGSIFRSFKTSNDASAAVRQTSTNQSFSNGNQPSDGGDGTQILRFFRVSASTVTPS